LDLITPDTMTIGTMLPTTPLHKLLFDPLTGDSLPRFDLLIMTSGNRRGEPICLTNAEARTRLADVADFLLCHNREINLRNDDSLCIIQRGAPQVWRRARGFAPDPIRLALPLARCVLAMGAEIKNTIAIGYDANVVLSPHIGDLETPEALAGLEQVIQSLPAFLEQEPAAVAVDLHPDMHSSIIGKRIGRERGLPVVAVQHHHAHAAACMAEHGADTALALVFDGTGLGTDGTIWGAELLDLSGTHFRRLATFAGAPLPGGDPAVIRPARQLVGRWVDAGMEVSPAWLARLGLTEYQAGVWQQQCRKGINTPISHAAGRVFDAFSVLLGFAPESTTYDGQSAIRLEAAARRAVADNPPELPLMAREDGDILVVDWSEAIRLLSGFSLLQGRETTWALAVHHAIVRSALMMLEYGLSQSTTRNVALSGGVFMNRILNDLLVPELEARGLRVLLHRETPPNDGCISLGQAVIAGNMSSTTGA
jgi:hydrogenase maturation protein HypF